MCNTKAQCKGTELLILIVMSCFSGMRAVHIIHRVASVLVVIIACTNQRACPWPPGWESDLKERPEGPPKPTCRPIGLQVGFGSPECGHNTSLLLLLLREAYNFYLSTYANQY